MPGLPEEKATALFLNLAVEAFSTFKNLWIFKLASATLLLIVERNEDAKFL